MLRERLWRKEFDKLLKEMKALWNGQIDNVADPNDRSTASLYSDTYVYPTYKSTIYDHSVYVTISEFALPGGSLMGAADNVEYLSIFLYARCIFSAAIRHEMFIDRIKKKIGLEFEAQTGYEKFDRKYFIISKLKEDISRLKSMDVQQKITNLEPFSGLHFSKGGINSTHVIDNSDPLNVRNVEFIVKKLIDLAKLVSKNR